MQSQEGLSKCDLQVHLLLENMPRKCPAIKKKHDLDPSKFSFKDNYTMNKTGLNSFSTFKAGQPLLLKSKCSESQEGLSKRDLQVCVKVGSGGELDIYKKKIL